MQRRDPVSRLSGARKAYKSRLTEQPAPEPRTGADRIPGVRPVRTGVSKARTGVRATRSAVRSARSGYAAAKRQTEAFRAGADAFKRGEAREPEKREGL